MFIEAGSCQRYTEILKTGQYVVLSVWRKGKTMAYIEFKNVVKEYITGETSIKALDKASFQVERASLQ